MRNMWSSAIVAIFLPLMGIHSSAALAQPATTHATDEPVDLISVDNAVCIALLDRDLGQWAKEIEKQPLSTHASDLLRRLDVLVRAGHLNSALPVVDALADAKPPWSKEDCSSIADWLIHRQHTDLGRRFLEKFSNAEPGWGYVLLEQWEANGGTPEQIDKWLAARSEASIEYWLHERLRYRGKKGTADQLLSSMAAEVKAHPQDIKPAVAYLKALETAGVTSDVQWMADVCKPKLAYDSFELGQQLFGRSIPATIVLWNRSLQTPFKAEDNAAMNRADQKSQQGPDPRFTAEQRLRNWTREELARAYEQTGQAEKARPLIEQLVANSSDGLPPPGLGRIAGEAEPASMPSAGDARVRDAEPLEKDSPPYWLNRAEYFAGRKDVKEATDAYEKAWKLALLDPVVHFKDPRLYKSHVLQDYAQFWMKTHDASSAYELMWTKLKDVPLDGECARHVVDDMCRMEEFDAPHDDRDTKPKLIRGDDERLWAFFKAQKDWNDTERVMLQMIGNTAPEEYEPIWKKGEDLARGADPSRAYVLGWLMRYAGGSKLKPRAIHWLQDALARQTVADQREKTAFALFNAAIEIDDWQLAEQTWPMAKRHVGGDDAMSCMGQLAVAAANAKVQDVAMKHWASIANIDRWELRYLDEMIKAGLRDQLIAFYQQMTHDDPASEVPAEALRKLKAY